MRQVNPAPEPLAKPDCKTKRISDRIQDNGCAVAMQRDYRRCRATIRYGSIIDWMRSLQTTLWGIGWSRMSEVGGGERSPLALPIARGRVSIGKK